MFLRAVVLIFTVSSWLDNTDTSAGNVTPIMKEYPPPLRSLTLWYLPKVLLFLDTPRGSLISSLCLTFSFLRCHRFFSEHPFCVSLIFSGYEGMFRYKTYICSLCDSINKVSLFSNPAPNNVYTGKKEAGGFI